MSGNVKIFVFFYKAHKSYIFSNLLYKGFWKLLLSPLTLCIGRGTPSVVWD